MSGLVQKDKVKSLLVHGMVCRQPVIVLIRADKIVMVTHSMAATKWSTVRAVIKIRQIQAVQTYQLIPSYGKTSSQSYAYAVLLVANHF